MVKIQVDGKVIMAKKGSLLIDVLLENDINIPHFCYHKALGVDGNCRMCMVEIEGQKRPQIACDTPVGDGQIIRTKGEKINAVKKSILELELINHPVDCPICDQAGECKLQDYYLDVGLYESRLNTSKQKAKKQVDLGCDVMLDQERCVLCTRCVRFTKNITKTNELGVLTRADHSVISTFPGQNLNNNYAMNVVDLCPVGALTNKDFRFSKRVWFLKSDEIICDRCSKGCNIFSDHSEDKYNESKIYRYRPRFNEDVNGYFICDSGRLSYKNQNENRLKQCFFDENEVTYLQIIENIKQFLKQNISHVSFLISPNLSLEEMISVKMLSEHFACKLFYCNEGFYEKTFQDEFLKQADLSINETSAKILNIKNISKEEFANLSEFKICIGFDEKFYKNLGQIGILSPFTCESFENIKFAIPIKSHAQKVGHFINCDNILQKSTGNFNAKLGFDLINICSNLGNFEYKNQEQIFANFDFSLLKGIKYEC